MKAAVIRQFGELTVQDVPDPQLDDYSAVCRVLYGATCTGTDTHIIDGCFPWTGALPTILGHESIGEVVAVGSKVRHLQVGDIVTRVGAPAMPEVNLSITWGGFAQMGLAYDHWAMRADGLPSDRWMRHRVNQILPPSIDLRIGPMFTTWRETYSYFTRLGICGEGRSVLVIGSGGNGLAFAVHAANLDSPNVVLIGAARMRDAVLAKTGVHHYFDYRDANLVDVVKKTSPDGFDLIIDALGRNGAVDQMLPLLKPDGTVAVYGLDDRDNLTITPGLARGSFRYQPPSGYDEAEAHQAVCDLVRSNRLDASLWYDANAPYPLDEISDAYDAVRRRVSPKALVELSS